jgi:hypothetical protein
MTQEGSSYIIFYIVSVHLYQKSYATSFVFKWYSLVAPEMSITLLFVTFELHATDAHPLMKKSVSAFEHIYVELQQQSYCTESFSSFDSE